MRSTLLIALLVAGLSGGCGIDPDGQSGGNGRRDVATDLPLGEWITDEDGVDYAKGDRTDWRKVVVPRDGTLTVQIACDNKDAEVVAALFDRYGRLLGEKKKPRGLSDHINFEGPVEPGKYFVRINAQKSEDSTVYSIRASMEGGVGLGDIPPPE